MGLGAESFTVQGPEARFQSVSIKIIGMKYAANIFRRKIQVTLGCFLTYCDVLIFLIQNLPICIQSVQDYCLQRLLTRSESTILLCEFRTKNVHSGEIADNALGAVAPGYWILSCRLPAQIAKSASMCMERL